MRSNHCLVLQAIQASCFMMVWTVYSQTGMYNPLKSNLDSKDNDGLRRGYLVVLSQRLECITHGSIILLLLLSLSFESRLSPLIGERTSCRIMYSKKSSTNVTLTHIRVRPMSVWYENTTYINKARASMAKNRDLEVLFPEIAIWFPSSKFDKFEVM